MDYTKHYGLLISKARTRNKLQCYVEIHHIIPKSEGGLDDPSNLVELTAREHFIAHWLLYRINPKVASRAHSFWRMCNGRGKVKVENWITIPSRAYEEARCAHSIAISRALVGRKKTKEHVEKVAVANRGKKRSVESKLKMSLAKKGKLLTQEHKNNMKGRTPWNKGIPMIEERRIKQSQRLTGNSNAGKACSIKGVTYSSATVAARIIGMSLATLKNRIYSTKRLEYYYV